LLPLSGSRTCTTIRRTSRRNTGQPAGFPLQRCGRGSQLFGDRPRCDRGRESQTSAAGPGVSRWV
jgi:hypothetical protein